MAKLTKKQERKLDTILDRLLSVQNYLDEEDVVGIAHKEVLPKGNSYVIRSKACLSDHHPEYVNIVTHKVGSDILQLKNAIRDLNWFLEEYKQ